jgi:hypothetical protein
MRSYIVMAVEYPLDEPGSPELMCRLKIPKSLVPFILIVSPPFYTGYSSQAQSFCSLLQHHFRRFTMVGRARDRSNEATLGRMVPATVGGLDCRGDRAGVKSR